MLPHKPSKGPLLLLNFTSSVVSRWLRNGVGRVIKTHQAELGPITDESRQEIEEFLTKPPKELRAA